MDHFQYQHGVGRGSQLENNLPLADPNSIGYLLHKDDGVGEVLHRGLYGAKNKTYQPLEALHEPPHAGHDSDSGVR